MLKARNLSEFVVKYGGGDDQLFMDAKQTPRMDARLRIDSGQGLNDYRFGLTHTPARDRLIQTAPAKLIAQVIPGYDEQKAVFGPLIAENIGLDVIRRKCPGFNAWLTRLETLADQ